jgi:dihydrofolate reductase
MLYSIILACTFEGGIGYNNCIPWDIKNELYLFKQITGNKDQFKQNAVIMGKNTWNSLPIKPLKNRLNIIITSDNNFINIDNIISFSNIDSAFEYCERSININKVFVIGGKSIYDLCLNNERYFKNIEYVYLSVIYNYYHCNIFINLKKILTNFKCNYDTIIFNPQFLHMRMSKKLI